MTDNHGGGHKHSHSVCTGRSAAVHAESWQVPAVTPTLLSAVFPTSRSPCFCHWLKSYDFFASMPPMFLNLYVGYICIKNMNLKSVPAFINCFCFDSALSRTSLRMFKGRVCGGILSESVRIGGCISASSHITETAPPRTTTPQACFKPFVMDAVIVHAENPHLAESLRGLAPPVSPSLPCGLGFMAHF